MMRAVAPRLVCLGIVLSFALPAKAAVEGARLAATPSAQRSAEGHGPNLAVDNNEGTLWLANREAVPDNNRVWFQLDLGEVKPVARLHWLAARGEPYPASSPSLYRVQVSKNGSQWTTVPPPPNSARNRPAQQSLGGNSSIRTTVINELNGNVLLNADARYVRLETARINDGTGWALGLKEIWVTEGRDTSDLAKSFRPRIAATEGSVTLSWTVPPSIRPQKIRLYRGIKPGTAAGEILATFPATTMTYQDKIPNWSLRYYRVEAMDAQGNSVLLSEPAAAVARPPAASVPRVETFAFWYQTYKPSTDPDASLKHIGNAPFVIGPGFSAAADLAKNGRGLLPYVTYYQTADWTSKFPRLADSQRVAAEIAPLCFYRPSLRFPESPPGYVPSLFCRPGHVEYNAAAVQYTICPNSARFRELALAHAMKQLEGGASGFFIDNGFEDDVAAPAVCESDQHVHSYGNSLTASDAFLGIALEVSCEVKKRRPDGVVMINGGAPQQAAFFGLTLGDVCDGQLWESYLRSSHSTPLEHVADWEQVYRRSVQEEQNWLATPPRHMFVLSYPWDRREAFFCYATAKLCHLPWSACLGNGDPEHKVFGGHFGTYPELVNLRLGPPVNARQWGGVRYGIIYAREYARGLVVVNPSREIQWAKIPLQKSQRYREIYEGREGESSFVSLEIPAESGRVFLWR